ncbi:MAG: hypothetical protein JJU15_03090 [Pararhodobacter sp.]|nr:hypothetical protein [Pararhodobacter sp.]
MERTTLRAMVAASALCAAPLPAVAEGALSFTFDGASIEFVAQLEGARTGFTRFASVDAVSIEGVQGQARLVLELALPPGARTGDAPHDARISYRPDGFRDYWVSPSDVPEGAVIVELLDLSGPSPRISGQFSVPLCFTRTPVHMPDLSRCLPAHGQFDTALMRD